MTCESECTASSELQFVGHQNFLLDAQALHGVFPNPPAIVLGGKSAGGDAAEDSFASAWGLAGTVSPTVLPFFPPGSANPIYPQQSIFADAAGVNPLFDRFGVIAGSNDLAIAAFLHLQTNGGLPSVGEGLIDFATNVVLPHGNVHLLTVSSTTVWNPNFLPWNQHHIFLNDDVTLWGSQASGGSGVLDFLTNPAQLGITP